MKENNHFDHEITTERISYLDGWRGVAISLVLLDHFFHLQTGWVGVDIFFSLSGFLMSGILFVKKTPLGIFYKRRLSRILPVFVLFVSLIYICGFIAKSSEAQNYFFTLGFLRSYFPATPTIFHTDLPIGHLWSLNIEEHCYVTLSMITFLSLNRKATGWLVLALGIVSVAIGILYHFQTTTQTIYYQLHTEVRASHLLISAGYFLLASEYKIQLHGRYIPLLIVALAICYTGLIPGAYIILSPFLSALLVNHLGSAGRFYREFLESRALVLLGLWSFSIYVWQQVFYFSIGRFAPDNFAIRSLACLLAVAVGAASFHFYEGPIRKFINNSTARQIWSLVSSGKRHT